MITKGVMASGHEVIRVSRHSSNDEVVGIVGDVPADALAGYQIRRGHYEYQQSGWVGSIRLVFGPVEEAQPAIWLGDWLRRLEA